MSTLKGLREKRDAALAARHLDIPVAGLTNVQARFRPASFKETSRLSERLEKTVRDKTARDQMLSAGSLGLAFVALVDDDGAVLTNDLAEVAEEFCPDIENPTAGDTMLGLFTDDLPMYKAAERLANWSQETEAAEDSSGN